MNRLLPLIALLALSGCAGCKPAGGGAAPDAGSRPDGALCELYADARVVGTYPVDRIPEASGLVVSALDPTVLWLHNDSGDAAVLYAVRDTGAYLGGLRLEGATAIDWEDLADGPCPEGLEGERCLYIGDFGDNLTERANVHLYIVPEPALGETGTLGELTADTFWRIPFRYPDGPRDAETLLVAPDGTVGVVSKGMREDPAIYRFPGPLQNRMGVTLEWIGRFDIRDIDPSSPWFTGGAIHPSGSRLLLRTYESVIAFDAEDPFSDAALAAAPIRFFPAATEPQGEAIAWHPAGQSYFTVSEQRGSISRYDCR